jgi:peroxiredoxin
MMYLQQTPTSSITGPGLISALLLVFSMWFTSCSNSGMDDMVTPDNDPTDDQNSMMDDEKAETAPNFVLQNLSGATIQLADFEDKVVVLFFFGNTCPACKAVGPTVEKDLHIAYSGKPGYVILGLDVWDGNSSAVQSFKDITGITFPLLLDASGVGSDYKTTYDRLVVIDKAGEIAHKGSRPAATDLATVKSVIDDLLEDM